MAANPAGKKDGGGGIAGTIAVALALGVLGAGAGGYLGYSLSGDPAPARDKATGEDETAALSTSEKNDPVDEGHSRTSEGEPAKSSGHGAGQGGAHGKGQVDDAKATKNARPPDLSVMEVKELPPVVTNLGEPETAWIRLQAAIVFDPKEFPHAEKLVPEIMSDITAYLRSLSVSSLEGAAGLRRLREELGERVAIRSEHKVREFIIETMVVQ